MYSVLSKRSQIKENMLYDFIYTILGHNKLIYSNKKECSGFLELREAKMNWKGGVRSMEYVDSTRGETPSCEFTI